VTPSGDSSLHVGQLFNGDVVIESLVLNLVAR